MSQSLTSQKKRGPRPTGKGAPILVRVQPQLIALIDDWAARQHDAPSRPEAIRRIVEQTMGAMAIPLPSEAANEAVFEAAFIVGIVLQHLAKTEPRFRDTISGALDDAASHVENTVTAVVLKQMRTIAVGSEDAVRAAPRKVARTKRTPR
jgi:hypothetical protein